mmetsp:Transcript_9642/g.23925  ORF Transcript_9642/g.23925 Transcript_9642/m.23925 type:complete len:324 (-) Transcript_9642:182-1153(-)
MPSATTQQRCVTPPGSAGGQQARRTRQPPRRGLRALLAHGLQQAREVKLGGGHFALGDGEARALERLLYVRLGVQVRARGLGGAGEQLADALERGVVGRVGRKRDDEALVRQRRQVCDHGVSLVLRVVDHDVQARDRVVAPAHALQVQRLKLGRHRGRVAGGGAGLLKAARSLGSHGGADVAGAHGRAAQGQGDGQRACAAAAVGHRGAHHAALLVQPAQHLVHGLRVALADVQLHLVHVVSLTVNLVPALEAGGVEVVLDRLQLIATGLLHLLLAPLLWVGGHEQTSKTGDGSTTTNSECQSTAVHISRVEELGSLGHRGSS